MELARHRRNVGMTLERVSGRLGMSISTLSRLENGKREPTSEEVAAVLAILGVTGVDRDHLLARARGELWCTGMVENSSPSMQSRTYVAFESQATVITSFQLLLVPGLAQTAEYAQAVISAIQVAEDEPDVEARVVIRMGRKAILTRKRPPQLNLIMTELGLRQPIGGPKAMARQVRSLIDLADRDNVSIRIIPITVPAHAGLIGQFVILEFASDPTVVHIEARTTGLFRDDPDEVEIYRLHAEKLAALALDKAGSVELMRSIARDLVE
nr:Putative DNA-binding protein [Kibdelosporangium sp. MJ126-NF4]CTQ96008.1 Putative DNA-binding protein [Kibdelosporangium sp. MJ126-NF4]